MCHLNPIEGTKLNEYVIHLLHKNNIDTASCFLRFEDAKLCKITNLTHIQIATIKSKVRQIYEPQVVQAVYYCDPVWKVKYVTGIGSLDSIIGKNFQPGRIYEICGFSATGKSLFCTTMAINFVQIHSANVIYVDTKNDFSGTRMHRILMARGVPKDEIGCVMQKIIVERCFSLRELISVLKKLMEVLKNQQLMAKLVIVDSLPAVWYLFHGEDGSKMGKLLLTQCSSLLKKITKEYKLFTICVNCMVRKTSELEQVAKDEFDLIGKQLQQGHQQINQLYVSSSFFQPSLGKCWDAVPTIRLTIEDPFYEAILNDVSTKNSTVQSQNNLVEQINKNQRIIRVSKSCYGLTGSECIIRIGDIGMH